MDAYPHSNDLAIEEVILMQEVRNSKGKLVCRADANLKLVEIIGKGQRTVVCFKPDGYVEVKNSQVQ
jgi:hypothetical protein